VIVLGSSQQESLDVNGGDTCPTAVSGGNLNCSSGDVQPKGTPTQANDSSVTAHLCSSRETSCVYGGIAMSNLHAGTVVKNKFNQLPDDVWAAELQWACLQCRKICLGSFDNRRTQCLLKHWQVWTCQSASASSLGRYALSSLDNHVR